MADKVIQISTNIVLTSSELDELVEQSKLDRDSHITAKRFYESHQKNVIQAIQDEIFKRKVIKRNND